MNTPHTHPRATEILYLVYGEMEAGFIEENGSRFVHNALTKGQGTLFPHGSIHYQINTGCDPVVFVAALNDEDPGTSQIAQRCEFYSCSLLLYPLTCPLQSSGSLRTSPRPLSGILVSRRLPVLLLGYVFHTSSSQRTPQTGSLQIPDNMAFGVERCLKKCNMTRSEQNKKQQQPRTAENALPLGTK